MGWRDAPEHIKVDIPPDLRSGSTRGIDERHPFNIYAFGYYIWQQMNNWPVEGTDNYKQQIERLSCYITPRFKGELERDYQQRLLNHESHPLSRTSGNAGSPVHGQTSLCGIWRQLGGVLRRQRKRDVPVRDRQRHFCSIPLRVVRWDVDPECNLWGLALDGFYKKPRRLEGSSREQDDVQNTSSEIGE